MKSYIKKFIDIDLSDLPAVGGKNSSLGEMFSKLSSKGIPIPDGFATTAFSFEEFLRNNNLHGPLKDLMLSLDRTNYSNLRETGVAARKLMMHAAMPLSLIEEIQKAYHELGGGENVDVAVRSSATAEDLPDASFAGQHESYLNVKGSDEVIHAVQKCFASLFTDRAIKYREDKGFEHDKVAISVGVQKMVRSDKASSGVVFTLEPESGFSDIIHISGVWGLGENIVQGTVTPDEFFVFKPSLRNGFDPIVQRKLGSKEKTMVYDQHEKGTVVNLDTSVELQKQFVIDDEEVKMIARWSLIIEEHYRKPMDIEWAKDGNTGQIYIIQARPETVHSRRDPLQIREYSLVGKPRSIVQGEAIGSKIATGIARVLNSPEDAFKLNEGDIVVTSLTSPDWDPVLKKSAAIITDKGGRTSHASIVARELGVPAIVGCGDATGKIMDGSVITVSCAEGKRGSVYEGKIDFELKVIDVKDIQRPEHTQVMLIAGDPGKAFALSFYPNDGVGLMRMEFIITHFIQVHPMALVKFGELIDSGARDKINMITEGYAQKEQFFIDKLAEGVATIAAAFYPKDVIVRMSDFKTNEYANLLGGKQFEPPEENPMIGFRGASRYYNDLYKDGFRLECLAIKKVRERMGLQNVKVMIPFCRTVEEGRKVIEVMKENGLVQHEHGLEVYVMAEIPSNVMLAEQFAGIFDGFSIGSNDLTQLTLGIDRDSSLVSSLFSEQNEAAKQMISLMIRRAREAGVKIGLCGQAPSDFPEFAQFLVEQGINSISFNEDALLKGMENIVHAERRMKLQEELVI